MAGRNNNPIEVMFDKACAGPKKKKKQVHRGQNWHPRMLPITLNVKAISTNDKKKYG